MFSGVFFPFIFGFVLAYVLNPATEYLENKGLNRTLSAVAVMAGAGCALFLFFLLFVPILTAQANALIQNVPSYIERLNMYIESRFGFLGKEYFAYDSQDFPKQIITALQSSLGSSGALFSGIIAGGANIFRWVTFLVVAPVVAFYLLLDWNHMIEKVNSLLPKEHAPEIRNIITDIDKVQSAFIRGQLKVCAVQSVYFVTVFNIVGLQYAFVLGLVAGILSFIPYIGASIGFLAAFSVALAQFGGDYVSLSMVAGLYILGQTLEGYLWIPKLVGESVDLHPVWVMFALMAFGSVMGLTGMLIAVPVAASVGVLARYAISRYKMSEYYISGSRIL